jgi:hypothetical protein
MANPNIVGVTTILAKTTMLALTSTSATAIVSNAVSSGKVFKVNSLYIANVDGSAACDVTVRVYNQDDIGGTGFAIASTVAVPADATLIVIGKDAPLYLTEDMSIGATAATANDLEVVVSFEEIS